MFRGARLLMPTEAADVFSFARLLTLLAIPPDTVKRA